MQEREKKNPGAVGGAALGLVASKALSQNPGPDLEGRAWGLGQYVEVAAELKVVTPETATLVRLAKDFRDLIHPARVARLKQKCDHSTALGALAAMEAVARDLTP